MTATPHVTRRHVLIGSVTTVGSLVTTGLTRAGNQTPSVTFENQGTTGESVTVSEVITDEPVYYRLTGKRGKTIYTEGQLDGGQQLTDLSLDLSTQITENGEYVFSLFPTGGGSSIAHDRAWIVRSEQGEYTEGMAIQEVAASPDKGFNYPYFLYVPMTPGSWDETTPLLVQQNNSPSVSDDFAYHKEYAKNAIESGAAREISERLSLPLLIPVIPKPESGPVNWRHRTQALDRDALKISEGPLKRVDLQVKEMIEDAQTRLDGEGYPVRDEVILNGFSGSGKFAQRFPMLHPEVVLSVSAGGLAGMPLLPLENAKGHTLKYHIGIADVEKITGQSVDVSAVTEVNQFLYEGGEDTKDTIGHDDTWTSDSQEQIALDVYGEEMIERFRYAETVFETAGMNATFEVYDEAGHTPRPAIDDIVEFHKQFLNNQEASQTTTESVTTEPSKFTDTTGENQVPKEESTTSTRTESPGFGIAGSIASLVGLAYWMKRSLGSEP